MPILFNNQNDARLIAIEQTDWYKHKKDNILHAKIEYKIMCDAMQKKINNQPIEKIIDENNRKLSKRESISKKNKKQDNIDYMIHNSCAKNFVIQRFKSEYREVKKHIDDQVDIEMGKYDEYKQKLNCSEDDVINQIVEERGSISRDQLLLIYQAGQDHGKSQQQAEQGIQNLIQNYAPNLDDQVKRYYALRKIGSILTDLNNCDQDFINKLSVYDRKQINEVLDIIDNAKDGDIELIYNERIYQYRDYSKSKWYSSKLVRIVFSYCLPTYIKHIYKAYELYVEFASLYDRFEYNIEPRNTGVVTKVIDFFKKELTPKVYNRKVEETIRQPFTLCDKLTQYYIDNINNSDDKLRIQIKDLILQHYDDKYYPDNINNIICSVEQDFSIKILISDDDQFFHQEYGVYPDQRCIIQTETPIIQINGTLDTHNNNYYANNITYGFGPSS